MERGNMDEVEARQLYNDKIAPVTEMGFITNSKWGFTIGFSPDWLIGEVGQAECKSRKQKYQLQTIANDEIDSDFMIQIQTGLLVSEREWCDFIQYSGGMPMYAHRCYPDDVVQKAIIEAATKFENDAAEIMKRYESEAKKYLPTERKIYDLEIDV